jgi:hypothetical protein
MQSEATPLPVVRGCDGCTLCCKVMGVHALAKPQGTWCRHCRIGAGCGIYAERPEECVTFNCGYLVLPHLTPEWKPAVSHLVISSGVSRDRLSIHVDPSRPDAWRKQPYYGVMKQWAAQALAKRQQVVVMIGHRSIVMLPDRDVDFGVLAPDEMIVMGETPTLQGASYEPFVVRRDSVLGQGVEAADGRPVAVREGDGEGLRRGRVLA